MALSIDGTNGIILPVGSLTKPSLGTAGAGMHVPVANTLSFVTNSQSRVTIDSSGTVTVANNFVVSGNTTVSGTTIPIGKTLVTLDDNQTLTNKAISGSNNTLSNIGNSSLTNSAITFGATAQALGSTVSAINAVSLGQGVGGAAAGAFTTLSASSTVSGTGFSTYLASPPAIGGTTPAAGKFTTLEATGNTTLGDASGDTVALQAGTAALPTLIPNGDPNTGLWFPAADTIEASTAGSERLRIDSSGNVGIGVSSPGAKLDVSGSINGSGTLSIAGAAIPTTANNERITISNQYDTTIQARYYGATGVTQKYLNVGWNLATYGSYSSGYMVNGDSGIYRPSASNTLYIAGNVHLFGSLSANGFTNTSPTFTERMRIDSSGNLLLRQSSNAANTSVSFNTTVQDALTLDSSGNLGLGATTFGTSATKTLALSTGTAPSTGPADTIQLYSTDLSAGNTMLSLYTEGTCVNANTTAAATHRIAVRINGTVYYLLANTAA
nr:MAG: hypothetical protein [Caudoviricetes sp.]